MKKFFFILCLFFATLYSEAQSIQNVFFNNTPSYFPGGSISFHIKPVGVFPLGTSFTLQLMDAAGSTVINPNIGSSNEFFIPVLNGTLPQGLASGTYSLRAVASNGTFSPASAPFLVQGSSGFLRPGLDTTTTVLGVNCYKGDKNFFGFVDKGINATSSPISFTLESTPGASYTAKLINPTTNTATTIPVSTTFLPYTLTLPSGLSTNYYTLELTKTIGGLTSSYSYVYLFNTGGTSLGNTSSENVCANDTVYFSIDQSIVTKNYPGSVYTLNYGDGSPVTTYTHAQFVSETLKHAFTTPTCSDPHANDGKFKIELYLYNKGIKINGNNNCDTLIKNGNGTVKFVNTSKAPVAQFAADSFYCINSSVLLVNQTIDGAYGTTTVCQTKNLINWFIKSPTSPVYSQVPASWILSPSGNLQIPANMLNQLGTWSVVLTAQNPEGCTLVTADTNYFCIEPKPVPNFTINGEAGISGCTPLVVHTNNTTNTNGCRAFTFNWQVYSAASVLAIPNTDYTITPNDSATAPDFTFLRPGTYNIRLTVTNSCGTFFREHGVTIKQKAEVALPPGKRYCDLKSINFQTNAAHTPAYNTNAGTELYQWSITPATYTVLSGNLNSKYIYVKFNQYTTYNVSVHFTNDCGTADASQQIIFDEPVTANAGLDTTICFNTMSLPVSATGIGPFIAGNWTSSGGGSFTNANLPNTTYNFAGIDKTNLAVNLIYSVMPPTESVCPAGVDTALVTIRPENKITNSTALSLCSGGSVNYTPTATFSSSTFMWTSTVVSGTVSGNSASGSGAITDILTNGSNSTNAVVSYTVTPIKDGCDGTPSTFQVTVKPLPLISSATPSHPTTCGGTNGTISLHGLSSGTNYTVSYLKNGVLTTATFTATTSGSVLIPNLSAGNYTNISASLAGCSSNVIASVLLTDPNPPAPPTAGNNGPLCSGATLNLTASSTTSGAIGYSWTGPNGFSSTQQNPLITNTTIANAGTYQVTASLNGCVSSQASTSIVIKQTPINNTASSNSPVCSGSTINLNAASGTSGASYNWTGPNGFTSNLANPSIPAATTANAGTYNMVATLNNCNAAPVTTTVAVNPLPIISGSSFTNPTACNTPNGTISLTGLTPSVTYTAFYSKNGGAPISTFLVSNAGGNVVIPNLTAGNYSNVFVSLNGCPSNVVGPFALSDPNPPATPTASSNAPVCSGATLALFASSTTPGVSYSWSGPNGFNSASQNPTINPINLAGSGTYQVTATLASCVSSAGAVTVQISPTPVNPTVSSNSPVCSGNTLNLFATSSVGASYSWSGPNGFTSSFQNPTISNVTSAAGGTYNVVATLGNCTSTSNSTAVVINAVPVISSPVGHDPVQCNTYTGFIQLSGLLSSTTYVVNYTKNGNTPTSATIVSSSTGELTINGLSAGSYTNISVALNNCLSNLVGPISLADPASPATPSVSSNSPVCSGNTLSLNASIATAGNATYAWTGPNNYTSNQQNATLSNVQVAAAGNYSVTATVNGCTSTAAVVNVKINQSPATPVIVSNSPVCTGNTITLSASTSTAGSMTYAWTGPNGFTSTLQNPSIMNATLANSGNYSIVITAVNGNCASSVTAAPVSVNTTPAISQVIGSNPTKCASATGSITLQGLASTNVYSVSYVKNGGAPIVSTITSTAAGDVVIANLNAGTYSSISVTAYGCMSNSVGPVTLVDPNPPAIPVAVSNSPICSGATLNLSATSATTGSISYAWSSANGFSSNLQNPTILNTPVSASGTYFVTATINNCTSQPATVVVDVQALPAAPMVSPTITYCTGATATPLHATALPGHTLTWYNVSTGGTASVLAPTPSTSTVGTTNYYVSQKNALGCESPRSQIAVTINPDAKAFYSYTKDTSCATFVLTASEIQPAIYPGQNSSYEWYAGGIFIGIGTTFPGYTISQQGTGVDIKLKTLSLFGCKADSVTHKFVTKAVPLPSFNVNTLEGCGPLAVQLMNTTPQGSQFKYAWDFGNGQVSNQFNPGTIIFQPNPTYNDTVYTITLSAFTSCDTLRTTKSIRVKSKPKALFAPDRVIGCSPFTVLFTNNSMGVGNNYTWLFGDGTIVSTGVRDTISHTYHTATRDTFYVKLVATNSCGSDTLRYSLIVSPNTIKLNVTVNATEVYGCSPHTVQFFNTSSGATSFFWDFADGNKLSTTANLQSVNHVFQQAGVYPVTIRATNGCSDTTVTRTITVFPKPTAAFTVNQTTHCLGDTLRTSNSSAGATSYQWNFGDGATSVLANPVHAYAMPGNYKVRLVTLRLNAPGNICTDTLYKDITVTASTTGSFKASDTASICAPLTVTFTNQNVPAVSAVWDFGDGTTGTGDVVNHKFNLPGTYKVKLTALVPGGCTYITTNDIVVSGPSGQFLYTGGYVCDSTAVRFEGVASPATDSLTFNFGDGTSVTTINRVVFHTYANPGLYVPTISFNSNAGCRFLVKGIDTIKVDRMTGAFTATQQRACGSTVVNFRDTSTVFFGKASVVFDFGDGTTGTGSNLFHTYTISGNYTVTMKVTSNSGCISIKRQQVQVIVYNKPVTTIINNATGCARQEAVFTADIQSADAINLIQWTTSNGITSSANPFKSVFSVPGVYTIRLVTGTVNGCFDTTTSSITINPTPTVIASADLTLCKDGSAPLLANPSNLQYNWFPTQGLSCTTCPNPIATPDASTPYVVQGTNGFGCSAYDTIVVTVIQPLSMIVAANKDSICLGQSSNLSAAGAASYLWTGPNLSSTNISNPIATPTATTTYTVVGSDAFNCFTDTKNVTVAVGNIPTVNLGPDLVLATGTVRPMISTITNGPIRTLQWTPPTDLSCANCAVPSATIKKDITYTLKVTTFFGCTASDTISIKAFCQDVQTFVPNAFTPDGDGINDILMVRGSGIAQVKSFRIFNRWGEVVFERANFSPNNPAYGWDGRVKGVIGQPDVYVYTVEVICENGTPYTYKGNVSVLK